MTPCRPTSSPRATPAAPTPSRRGRGRECGGAGGGSFGRGTGAGATGYSSVYTVDSANGHLQETYLPYMGDAWTTQDLSATGGTLAGTPPVMPGTQPVALVHCGYTSVYTVDASSGDLQETYLPAIGDSWTTQDLSGRHPARHPADQHHADGRGAQYRGGSRVVRLRRVHQRLHRRPRR